MGIVDRPRAGKSTEDSDVQRIGDVVRENKVLRALVEQLRKKVLGEWRSGPIRGTDGEAKA